MSSSTTVGVGVIGLGFMGGVHLRALRAARKRGAPVRTVAVWDHRAEKCAEGGRGVRGNLTTTDAEPLFDPGSVRVHETCDALLADPEVTAVHICTPTDSHLEWIERSAQAGKHVLVEKPVALGRAAIEETAARVADAGVHVMPAMCMRFWPGWTWLKDRLADGSLGALRALTCLRIGAPPTWSSDFYLDVVRSGDAIVDLHIHDVDFLRWLFGPPSRVSTVGTTRHLTTSYSFERTETMVVAEGGWLPTPGAPFRMEYRASFEKGVAEFSIGADPWLQLHTPDGVVHPEVPLGDGYDGEIAHWVESLAAGRAPGPTLAEAADVMRIIEAERESLRSGGPISL